MADILRDVFRKRLEEQVDAEGRYWLCEKNPRIDQDMTEQGCFLHDELEPAACE